MATEPRKTIRAFLALELEASSLRRVARVADRLRMGSGAPSATWVPSTRMHVTMKFMAEFPVESIEPLREALRPLIEGKPAPSACSFRLSAFPRIEQARIVIAELLDTTGELGRLAEEVDRLAQDCGILKEDRPFRPHVTLARLKRPYDTRRWLRPELAGMSGECRAASLTLFQSALSAAEPIYTPLARFAFDVG
jgi:2'-5' RNA ligase